MRNVSKRPSLTGLDEDSPYIKKNKTLNINEVEELKLPKLKEASEQKA